MTLGDWLDEVVSEQAAGQGVGAEDVADDDRLESIGERLQRLASRDRAAARQNRPTPARPGNVRRDADEDDEDPTGSRVETALAKIEARAALSEQRTAKALKSVADWIERDASQRAAESARTAEIGAKERAEMEGTGDTRAAPPRPPMVEAKYESIDQRLEALAKRMEAGSRSAFSRPRSQSHNEPPAAPAEPPKRPAAANEAAVETLRPERRLSDSEAESLRAEIAAMRKSLADLAPRNSGVALEGALLDFGRRLEATRRAALNPEALKPIENMLREALSALRRQNLQPAVGGVDRDLSALNQKIYVLARTSVDPELLDQVRRQTGDIRRQVAAVALQSAPLARIERDVEQLADRVERLATNPVPRAEIDTLAHALNETRNKIERATPPSALASIAERLAALTSRIDNALRRDAAPDPRPRENLARPFEAVRAPLDPPSDVAARARKLESTLADLHVKFDGATLASSSSSKSLDATLKQLLSRLDDVAARACAPRAIDAAPFQDLGRRIEAVRASLDQLSDLSAHTHQLEAAFADLSERLDASIGQSVKGAQLNSALQQLVRRVEDLAARPAAPQTLDPAPFRDLARRIDAVRVSLEQRGDFAEQARRVEAALADVRDTVERSFNPSQANAALNSTLQQLVGRLDDLVDRPPAGDAFNPAPFQDLAQRIDAVRAALEKRGGFAGEARGLENKLAELSDKLDDSLRAASASQAVNANLQRVVARLEGIARQPGLAGSADLGAVRDLASRIDGLRSTMDRQANLGPQLKSLASDVQEIRGRLETPQIGAPEAKQIIEAIQDLANRPPSGGAINLAPFHELARRIDAVRSAMDRQTDPGPQLASLASEVEEIRARLESSQISAPEAKQIIEAIQDLADRPPVNAAADLAPFHELARRIDAVRVSPRTTRRFHLRWARLRSQARRVEQ